MITRGNATVTLNANDWDRLISDYTYLQNARQHEEAENMFMIQFIKFYALEEEYRSFKKNFK